MRLTGPILGLSKEISPEQWVSAVKAMGFRAAYAPVKPETPDAEIESFAQIALENDIVIPEVGAWSSPVADDPKIRESGIDKSKRSLELAEKLGARCCVNISGSRGKEWAGPHPKNLTRETFDMIVEVVRDIIDSVQPTRTYYTLEAMPWMFPDSTESYAELLEAIDRKSFAVHFDPVNLIYSPQRYYTNGELIHEFVEKLGPHIKCCHAKDIRLSTTLTTHLDEVRPGLGELDYRTFLREVDRLDPDTPVVMEHLKSKEEYGEAAKHIRSFANDLGITT